MRALVLLLLLSTTTACTAIYLFNSSEDNLFCGPADEEPRCKDGFVCVVAADDKERCVPAGFKQEGEECIDSGECADGAICADVYADRCDGDAIAPEFALDCANRDLADKGLRCRRACKDDFTCGEDFRCFDLGDIPPFCQQGTCATDSDCVAGADRGLCIDEALNGGRSGLCRRQCDPLACASDQGVCTCQLDENCVTPPDEGVVSARAVCLPIGIVPEAQPCDAANFCDFGLTCAFFGNATACTQWCRFGGGAPACNAAGTTCQQADPVNDPNLGLCLR